LNTPFLPASLYKFLFGLLGIVYIVGLFVPLIDNDSAHHASIALRMHLTGDYISLIDQGGDYLDKPHLLFWLTAFSYKIFGVTAFAYKLPSLLFTILGTYSTYRLGKALYNKETGKLAALIVASSFAYILANTDVRMDAILTASIAFATWQLIEFIDQKKLLNAAGAALGLALGFSTKGHIAVFVPAVSALFYILYKKDWKIFINWKWLLLFILFGVFISPVVYAYYVQYNLHPEKVVRGKDHINGVKFILFNQSISRFSGEMGSDAKNDYLFFVHSFLWAFAPWSILTYIAVGGRIKRFLQRKEEWATTGAFVAMAIVVSLSGFKLPHYLNIVFPVSAVMAAVFILSKQQQPKWIKAIFAIQISIVVLLLLLLAFINGWAFPATATWIIVSTTFLLAIVFYFIKSNTWSRLQKAVTASVAVMILAFFLLNSNFYPKLLHYQAGQNLARITKGKVDPADVYSLPNSYSASYIFYSKSRFQTFDDSLLRSGKKIWLLAESKTLDEFRKQGYETGTVYTVPHFRITKLNFKFVNPNTRSNELWNMQIVEVISKKQP
jgi:4-amino-4-deoxy-L-arabinose transferase-like glycosyltransferase